MVALLALIVSGCAQQSFQLKDTPVAAPQKTATHHFFVSGIGQQKTIDAAQVCGGADNVVKTEVQQTFINGLLSVVTFGIYTPREARVYCSK
ncbi:Bor family protein [Salmonella enterica]|nr:Bor family protein [Salmonella enterica]